MVILTGRKRCRVFGANRAHRTFICIEKGACVRGRAQSCPSPVTGHHMGRDPGARASEPDRWGLKIAQLQTRREQRRGTRAQARAVRQLNRLQTYDPWAFSVLVRAVRTRARAWFGHIAAPQAPLLLRPAIKKRKERQEKGLFLFFFPSNRTQKHSSKYDSLDTTLGCHTQKLLFLLSLSSFLFFLLN